jgi:hypothetical protein
VMSSSIAGLTVLAQPSSTNLADCVSPAAGTSAALLAPQATPLVSWPCHVDVGVTFPLQHLDESVRQEATLSGWHPRMLHMA